MKAEFSITEGEKSMIEGEISAMESDAHDQVKISACAELACEKGEVEQQKRELGIEISAAQSRSPILKAMAGNSSISACENPSIRAGDGNSSITAGEKSMAEGEISARESDAHDQIKISACADPACEKGEVEQQQTLPDGPSHDQIKASACADPACEKAMAGNPAVRACENPSISAVNKPSTSAGENSIVPWISAGEKPSISAGENPSIIAGDKSMTEGEISARESDAHDHVKVSACEDPACEKGDVEQQQTLPDGTSQDQVKVSACANPACEKGEVKQQQTLPDGQQESAKFLGSHGALDSNLHQPWEFLKKSILASPVSNPSLEMKRLRVVFLKANLRRLGDSNRRIRLGQLMTLREHLLYDGF